METDAKILTMAYIAIILSLESLKMRFLYRYYEPNHWFTLNYSVFSIHFLSFEEPLVTITHQKVKTCKIIKEGQKFSRDDSYLRVNFEFLFQTRKKRKKLLVL